MSIEKSTESIRTCREVEEQFALKWNHLNPFNQPKKLTEIDEPIADSSAVYCLDIWHHISKFIDPEDVGRFSLICRDTATVTSTREFWNHLFLRHVSTSSNYQQLPDSLRTEQVLPRRQGLRADVIRALFYVYEPFKKRCEKRPLIEHCRNVRPPNIAQSQIHFTPTQEQILSRLNRGDLTGKCYSNYQLLPSTRRKHRSSYFDFFAFMPKCYFYVFQETKNDHQQQSNQQLQQSHQPHHQHNENNIYFNPFDGCIILYLKTLKNRRQTKTINESKPIKMTDSEVEARTSRLQTISIHPHGVIASRINRNVRMVDVSMKFVATKHRKNQPNIAHKHFYPDVVHMELYYWWEPNFRKVLREEY